MSTFQQQVIREAEQAARGQARFDIALEAAQKHAGWAFTPAGTTLVKKTITPASDSLRAFNEASMRGDPTRMAQAAKLLSKIDPDLAVFIALRTMLEHPNSALSQLALKVGRALETELMAATIVKEQPSLLVTLKQRLQYRYGHTSYLPQHVRKSLLRGIDEGKFDPEDEFGLARTWTREEAMRTGVKLIEIVIETTGLFRVEFFMRNKKTLRFITMDEGLLKWMDERHALLGSLSIFHAPMIAPPAPWEGVYGGGYLSDHIRPLRVVKRLHTKNIDLYAEADLSQVYAALNAIQATPWVVNKDAFEVAANIWEMGETVGDIPLRDNLPIPERSPEVEAAEKGSDIRKEYRRKARAVHEENNRLASKRLLAVQSLNMASELADHEAIYFPHQLDFRSRAYNICSGLSTQGPDLQKGLIKFKRGIPLGASGVRRLAIYGANAYGEDKISHDERVEWVAQNEAMIGSVAYDPMTDWSWAEADEPFQFLSFCLEWGKVLVQGEDTVSHLAVGIDGSCNGIQHYSAMLRDAVGGAAVNLVPSERPADLYGSVATRVNELLLAEEDPAKQWIAHSWHQFGVDRKITKRQVMVVPYGGTFASCKNYTEEAVRKAIKDGKNNPFGDDLYNATLYLSSVIWKAIGDTVVAAREGMAFIQAVAAVVSKSGKPLIWQTPAGFPVYQRYPNVKLHRVRTQLFGETIKLSYNSEQPGIDTGRQNLAIAPNFIHSLDAAAMMLTVNRCAEEGITDFAMVHDSYGTHAAHIERMGEITRQVFHDMYANTDVLSDWVDQVSANSGIPRDEFPAPPAKGSLDISKVLDSPYFFT